jgi:hypothetical protein
MSRFSKAAISCANTVLPETASLLKAMQEYEAHPQSPVCLYHLPPSDGRTYRRAALEGFIVYDGEKRGRLTAWGREVLSAIGDVS